MVSRLCELKTLPLALFCQSSKVSFQVSVPKVEKDDWNCKGQLITITMPLKSTFGEVKAKIEADTGMPPGKQKLQCESIFVKGKYSSVLPWLKRSFQIQTVWHFTISNRHPWY